MITWAQRLGGFALAMLLLVSFVVYYYINWKYLASVWPMG